MGKRLCLRGGKPLLFWDILRNADHRASLQRVFTRVRTPSLGAACCVDLDGENGPTFTGDLGICYSLADIRPKKDGVYAIITGLDVGNARKGTRGPALRRVYSNREFDAAPFMLETPATRDILLLDFKNELSSYEYQPQLLLEVQIFESVSGLIPGSSCGGTKRGTKLEVRKTHPKASLYNYLMAVNHLDSVLMIPEGVDTVPPGASLWDHPEDQGFCRQVMSFATIKSCNKNVLLLPSTRAITAPHSERLLTLVRPDRRTLLSVPGNDVAVVQTGLACAAEQAASMCLDQALGATYKVFKELVELVEDPRSGFFHKPPEWKDVPAMPPSRDTCPLWLEATVRRVDYWDVFRTSARRCSEGVLSPPVEGARDYRSFVRGGWQTQEGYEWALEKERLGEDLEASSAGGAPGSGRPFESREEALEVVGSDSDYRLQKLPDLSEYFSEGMPLSVSSTLKHCFVDGTTVSQYLLWRQTVGN